MNNQTFRQVLALIAILVPLLASGSAPPAKDPSVQLFHQLCAGTRADVPAVAKLARARGLAEITGAESARYLAGMPGRVWRGTIDSRNYAVTVQPNGVCTLFVFDGDVAQIQAAVEASLPPAASGIVVQKENLTARPEFASTAYRLHGGQVSERWVITTSSNPSTSLRALLSWSRL